MSDIPCITIVVQDSFLLSNGSDICGNKKAYNAKIFLSSLSVANPIRRIGP